MAGPEGVGPPSTPPGLLNGILHGRGPHGPDNLPNPNSPNGDTDSGNLPIQQPRNGDPDFNPPHANDFRGGLNDAGASTRGGLESQPQNLYAALSREPATPAPLGTADARLSPMTASETRPFVASQNVPQANPANTPTHSAPTHVAAVPANAAATVPVAVAATPQAVLNPAVPLTTQTAAPAHLSAPGVSGGIEQLGASLRPDALPVNPAVQQAPTAALPGVAAGSTMAVSPTVDSRGVTLAANDRIPGVRGELQAQGNTVAAGWRRRGRNKFDPAADRPRLRALFRRDQDADNGAQAWQWLFWLLGLVAYASIALAIVALMPGGSGLFSDQHRSGTSGGLIVLGCVSFAAAWWLARRIRRR
ncbi:hypothetical protein [Luteimonas aquatica]|uniref:hypothetical protein n=1 Tax=Luteimonas aquatica TaxID=450364 RepID=UPI001F5AA519|nr:hypothetical protein [Luteimonas aquatica]